MQATTLWYINGNEHDGYSVKDAGDRVVDVVADITSLEALQKVVRKNNEEFFDVIARDPELRAEFKVGA